jgi:hypothetical protein
MTLPDTYILRLLRLQSHALSHEIGLMPADAVLWKPAATEWSVHETLTHIRNIEREVFRFRLTQTATRDNPPLPFFDEVTYHKTHWSPDEPIQNILAEFVADRAAEVALLQTADWSRTGNHETRGPISLDWQANYIVNHTWEHLSQIMRVRLNYTAPVRQ